MPGQITSLLNLASAASEMDILYRIEMALAGEGNMIVYSLKLAIAQKKPATVIINTCKDMITDNRAAMEMMLGVSLCNRITRL